LALALEIRPQIVVTDWLMPVMDGVEFCKALRATDWGQSMYVIMLTGVDNEDEVTRAFEAGVDDYVTKPLKVRSLRARMRAALHYVQLLDAWESDRAKLKQFTAELAISNRKLEHYALTDRLTGLPNRRAGMEILGQAWSATSRSRQGLAVMMIDIDRFKGINDTHGHAVGDKVLTRVGKLIRASARREDHVSRIGGEEFLVICHNADLRSTVHAAERLRQKVRSEVIEADGVRLQASISIGVASKEDGMANADALMAAADRALYAAKQNGRDRTCLNAGGKLMLNRP
jgi:diguanylate cyclase (GGDEF)-like protein